MTCMRKYFYLLLAAVVLSGTLIGLVINSVIKWNSVDPVIRTKLGNIRGLKAGNGDYSMYLGVPYATVDMKNPFGRSIPFPKFEGVFDANDDSVMCPQIEDYNHTLTGSLDCLYLNIYVPNVASIQNPLPVLIYIPGGRNERPTTDNI
ncbi:acetylcholinesterase [Manduca sexta]|uniref:acetylcholinesterase n=1 Tax=Manduca sexta TaxID=7130 RepID=UPI00188F76D5|nr:acetylcholinesterase [Manduca sexta]